MIIQTPILINKFTKRHKGGNYCKHYIFTFRNIVNIVTFLAWIFCFFLDKIQDSFRLLNWHLFYKNNQTCLIKKFLINIFIYERFTVSSLLNTKSIVVLINFTFISSYIYGHSLLINFLILWKKETKYKKLPKYVKK